MMDVLLLAGMVPGYGGDTAVARFWGEYSRRIAEEGHYHAYVFLAESLASYTGRELREIDLLLDPLLSGCYRSHLFAESLYLMEGFRHRDIDNFIISASPHLFVKKAATMLPGVASHQATGIDRARSAGRLYDEVVNYAEGKTQRMELLCSQYQALPIFAAGNSWESDGPMLAQVRRQGGIALMINGGSAPPWAEGLGIHHVTLP
jgi:phosphoserine phosphatase